MIAPDDVQLAGIGAPQAAWLGLLDQGVTVTATGFEQAVHVRSRPSGSVLTCKQAAELAEVLVSAVAWNVEHQRLEAS